MRGCPPARGAASARPSVCPQGWLGTGGAGVAALSRCHRAICRQRARGTQPQPPAAAQCSQSAAELGKEGALSGTLGCCPSWSLWEVGVAPQGVTVPGMGHSRDSPALATNRLNVILFHPPLAPKKCRKEEVSVDLIAHIKNLPGETEPFPPESVQIHRDTSSFSSSSSSSSAWGPGWGQGHQLPAPQGAPVPWAPCCQPHQHFPCPGLSCPAPAPPPRCPQGATHTSCPGVGADLGVGKGGGTGARGGGSWPGAVLICFLVFLCIPRCPFSLCTK